MGASAAGERRHTLRRRAGDWLFRRVVTSGYAVSEASIRDFAQRLRDRKVRFLDGYASSLDWLAGHIHVHGPHDLRLQTVFSSGEVLRDHQKRRIEAVLRAKVLDRYATQEFGQLASECPHQRGLHVNTEGSVLELLDPVGRPVAPGRRGRVVVTQLDNYAMPLVRYALEDEAAWLPGACECGRAHARIIDVDGRRNDMLRGRDGRIVWGGIGNVLTDCPGMRRYQIIQKTLDLLIVRVAADRNLSQAEERSVARAAHATLGHEVEVRFEYVDEILPPPSGKHRYQICEVDPSELPRT